MYTNGYELTDTAGGIIGLIFGVLAFMIIIALILAVLQIIGQWKMFKKANEEGWKALIPIYNTYTLCKIIGVNPWWILVVFLSSFLGVIPVIGTLLTYAVTIYFTVIVAGSVAKSYGKDTGWAVGYALLCPFFSFALGVGSSEYQGAKPMNDPVMDKAMEVMGKKNESASTNAGTTPATDASVKFCASCGTKVDVNTKFCPNCGKEM
ncbi:MAG: zinc ribbon domain-containing protein [Firmicutes bacterium]|nr:zinc ribbon domain-containing protein [Bacillota bacterium]